jgi:hypothetical protein
MTAQPAFLRSLSMLWRKLQAGKGMDLPLFKELDGHPSTNFRSPTPLARLPTLEITAQNEKLAPDLNDPNALILNDSTEMADGKTRQLRSIRNIQKHPFSCCSFGRPHANPPLGRGFAC